MRQNQPNPEDTPKGTVSKWLSFQSDSNPYTILTIDLPQSITNLAHRAERGNPPQNVLDQILLFPSRPSQSLQRSLDPRRVAGRLELLQLSNLRLLNGRVDSL